MSSRSFNSQDVDSRKSKVYYYRGSLYDKLSTAKGLRTRDLNLIKKYRDQRNAIWIVQNYDKDPSRYDIYEGAVSYRKLDIDAS